MHIAVASLLLFVFCVPQDVGAQSEFEPGDNNVQRIENEDKLSVPLDKTEEVFSYILNRFVADTEFLTAFDPALTATYSDEFFVDTYFDTPEFTNMRNQNGLRKRARVNLVNPEEDPKSGRELMQIKLNGIDSSDPLSRAEYKFDIKYPKNFSSPDDRHPVVGIVDPILRTEFIMRAREALGVDPYRVREVLTIHQRRRRVYIKRDGVSAFTISFDDVKSTIGDTTVMLTEIEPEINEIMFTEGDETTRTYLKRLQAAIIGDIQKNFPFIERDLTPKYNKVFALFEQEIPSFRYRVFLGQKANVLAWSMLGVLGVLFLAAFGFFLHRRRMLA